MRIGLLIYDSLNSRSGGYLYDRMLVEHLRAVGDQVEVVSLPSGNYLRHLRDNLSQSLYRRLGNLDVDILLQDELNHPSLFNLNYSLRTQVVIPIISIVHHLRCSESHPSLRNYLYRWIETRYLKSVDGFIFNSNTTRISVQNLLENEVPWVVAYPAGDQLEADLTPEDITSRAKQGEPLRILFLGNLIPRKGLVNLLAALSMIPNERWVLNIVGDPEMDPGYVKDIKKLVLEKELENQVNLSGYLETQDLQKVMNESQLLVLASEYEGFGIVFLEGMAFGLPAIATTGGGAVEIISHGEDGFLVPPGDQNQLVYYLCQLMDDRELLARMSLAARQRYLKHPSWEDSASTIRDFLLKVIQDRKAK
jgi:glycosyltransferase involved in cell wall biosynthesis